MDGKLVLDRVAGHIQGRSHRRSEPADQPPAAYDPRDPVVNLERQALKLAVQRPALLGPAFDAMGSEVFTAPAHRSVRELIAACGGVATAGPVRAWVERLLGGAPNDNAR